MCPALAVNDPAAVADFLAQLPPSAHAGRLFAMGLGMALGTFVVRAWPGNRPHEAWALTLLFGAGAVFDVFRVDHGPALSICTIALVLPCVGWDSVGGHFSATDRRAFNTVLAEMLATTKAIPAKLRVDMCSPYPHQPMAKANTAPRYLKGITMPASSW